MPRPREGARRAGISHATIVQTTVLSEDCNNLITATMPQAWGNMNVGTSLAFACGHPCIVVRNAANAETTNIYALWVDFMLLGHAACNKPRRLHQWPRYCATATLRKLWPPISICLSARQHVTCSASVYVSSCRSLLLVVHIAVALAWHPGGAAGGTARGVYIYIYIYIALPGPFKLRE